MTPRAKIRSILRIIARAGDVTVKDILGHEMEPRHVAARQVAHVLVAKHLNITGPVALGRAFGRDHSTVINSFLAIERAMAKGESPKAVLYRTAEAKIAAVVIGPVSPHPEMTVGFKDARKRTSTDAGYIDNEGNIICNP